jgi:rod shape-determining protein MreD
MSWEIQMRVTPHTQAHVEVHKYRAGVVAGVALIALVLQAFLQKFGARADYLELPLLITLYFGLSRRSPSRGLLLGTAIGLLQDGLSRSPIGLYGISKTLVGYVASTIGGRIDVEHPLSRFAFTFLFFHFHQAILATTQRYLLARPAVFLDRKLLLASLVNAIIAVFLFPLLDRLRKPA